MNSINAVYHFQAFTPPARVQQDNISPPAKVQQENVPPPANKNDNTTPTKAILGGLIGLAVIGAGVYFAVKHKQSGKIKKAFEEIMGDGSSKNLSLKKIFNKKYNSYNIIAKDKATGHSVNTLVFRADDSLRQVIKYDELGKIAEKTTLQKDGSKIVTSYQDGLRYSVDRLKNGKYLQKTDLKIGEKGVNNIKEFDINTESCVKDTWFKKNGKTKDLVVEFEPHNQTTFFNDDGTIKEVLKNNI
ncbi:MAG: hypothetical protein PHX18_02445 [Candidatus Gastranaerophilales bacterium]|nr:hypothetical protein [Candidatus Gastranaerophilales bacterium]